ncbi:MAG TPA: RebB family R body protein, partial [Brevundimonas sp.]|nr:RebB family R body protein [Brevundimonas sp.]
MNDGMHDGTVNSRIVDSVSSVVTLNTGEAPSQAFGMLDAVMVESLGMAMHNAVMRQQGASMVGTAAVTAACAKMLQRQTYYMPPLPPDPSPQVEPIPGPIPPPTPVDMAYSDGEAAINELRAQAAGTGFEAAQAR